MSTALTELKWAAIIQTKKTWQITLEILRQVQMTFHLVVSSLEEYKQLLVGRLISPTDLSLTEIAATGKSTVRVFKYGLMVLGMKVSGKMIKPMAKEL